LGPGAGAYVLVYCAHIHLGFLVTERLGIFSFFSVILRLGFLRSSSFVRSRPSDLHFPALSIALFRLHIRLTLKAPPLSPPPMPSFSFLFRLLLWSSLRSFRRFGKGLYLCIPRWYITRRTVSFSINTACRD